MQVSAEDRALIDQYARAMQAGQAAEEELFTLFADDAEYVEAFDGPRQSHVGIDNIRAWFKDNWKNSPPGLTVVVDRVDIDGNSLRSEWTCDAPSFPSPVRGHDLFVLHDGRIKRLEVVVDGNSAS